ncbi:MAG: DUF4326 domain-containing protein [Rhizobiales bacterium]|nr:DUF4326 domain-containing protein [Hyphomicrobiales bacterium]
MTRPIRIQRQRVKGWRMPPSTVYVGRPSQWGNRFVVGARKNGFSGDEAETIAHYADYTKNVDLWDNWPLATASLAVEAFRKVQCHATFADRVRAELRGKNLACWCPLDQPCHADVLLELANGPICEAVP